MPVVSEMWLRQLLEHLVKVALDAPLLVSLVTVLVSLFPVEVFADFRVNTISGAFWTFCRHLHAADCVLFYLRNIPSLPAAENLWISNILCSIIFYNFITRRS